MYRYTYVHVCIYIYMYTSIVNCPNSKMLLVARKFSNKLWRPWVAGSGCFGRSRCQSSWTGVFLHSCTYADMNTFECANTHILIYI